MENKSIDNMTLDYWRMINSQTSDYESVSASGSWNDESSNLDYWKQVNVRTAEYESVVSQGSWLEADLLDEADD